MARIHSTVVFKKSFNTWLCLYNRIPTSFQVGESCAGWGICPSGPAPVFLLFLQRAQLRPTTWDPRPLLPQLPTPPSLAPLAAGSLSQRGSQPHARHHFEDSFPTPASGCSWPAAALLRHSDFSVSRRLFFKNYLSMAALSLRSFSGFLYLQRAGTTPRCVRRLQVLGIQQLQLTGPRASGLQRLWNSSSSVCGSQALEHPASAVVELQLSSLRLTGSRVRAQ